MKKELKSIFIAVMVMTLAFQVLPAAAEDTVSQGQFSIELAKALGFAVSSDADAIALLSTKGIVPGDNWVTADGIGDAFLNDILGDVCSSGLAVAALDTALTESGYTGTDLATLMQGLTCSEGTLVASSDTGEEGDTAQFLRLPGSGQDLSTVPGTAAGGPPQQQRPADISPF